MASLIPKYWRLKRLSTGIKMLLILTAALLPLGLIALFASIQSAHSKQLQREADARVIATADARQIDIMLLRGANVLHGLLPVAVPNAPACRALLDRDRGSLGPEAGFALFDAAGRARCTSSGFVQNALPPPRLDVGIDAALTAHPPGLRFSIKGVGGGYGVGFLPDTLLRRAIAGGDGNRSIILRQGEVRLALARAGHTAPLVHHVMVDAPVAGGQVRLMLTIAASPISAVEVLLVLLPLLMWAAAAGIGWVIVDQLLLRPLRQLHRTIELYRPGDGPLSLPRMTTPSEEIRALGDAFASTTNELAQRELELEDGLSRQVTLTREVHHRVKNNLQVVASLINLHSRGTSGEVADAYASIQRRVDALAVVHRNHYAELEENRGVALRSIIAELTANLRATAPLAAAHMTIDLAMIPAFITQDVAVPVAFLVTEIVELVMICDPSGSVSISLTRGEAPDRAILAVEAAGLGGGGCQSHPARARFERIITGLSRQLRSQLDYDAARGRYAITIAITSD